MKKTWVVALCVLFALVVEGNVRREDSWDVNIAQGPVRGYRDPDGDIFVFYNIPYATALTGPNKFKAPLPPPTWSQTFEAVDRGIRCPQHEAGLAWGQNIVLQEDCLVANVYVPDIQERNLTVLVNIHGGAFLVGYGDMVKPKNLIRTKHMIVVNFNYRLGIHGFLCLGTDDVPGNAGLKDQLALLRWVKNNIASFGGNPDDVTLSGYGAGGGSVDLLMLSKAARGLFKRVIPESGSHFSPFVQLDPLAVAKETAIKFNYTGDVDNINNLENFYKTASLELLTSDMFDDRKDSSFVFVPCVERDIGQEVVLDDSPFNILISGSYDKLPTLHGFAELEGLSSVDKFELWKTAMNEKFSDFLPEDLKFATDEEREAVAQTIKEFYFGNQPVSEENIVAYVNYFSDIVFSLPALRSIELQVAGGHNQLYLYEYTFVDENTPVIPHTNVSGASHTGQTTAIFDGTNMLVADTPEYTQMRSTLRQLWANFITLGDPVPAGSNLTVWPPVREKWAPHMSLGRVIELKETLLEDRARFWADIYSRFYNTPVPPAATDSASTLKSIWIVYLLVICNIVLK